MKIQHEPFLGWRTFRLKGIATSDPILVSVRCIPACYWNSSVVRAHEKPRRTPPPSWRNLFHILDDPLRRPGIYAYNEAQPIGNLLEDFVIDGLVAGTIVSVGTSVVRHEFGFRAEGALVTSIDLRYFPCVSLVPRYMYWLERNWTFCDHPVAYWCEIDSVDTAMGVRRTRPFCAKHAPAHLPRMGIESIADALMRRYGCDVNI